MWQVTVYSTYQLDNQSHQVTPLDRSAVHVVVRLSNGVEEWFQKKTEAYSGQCVCIQCMCIRMVV